MNELLIFTALIPVAFLVFGDTRKPSKIVIWLPGIVSAACVANSLYLHFDDPKWWGPLAAFMALVVSGLIEKKKMTAISVLSFLFVAQALLISGIGNIIVCLALADMLLNIEIFTSSELHRKNLAIHNIYKSLFSFFPILLGVLLQLQGDFFTLMVLVTIVLRLFSWPFNHWLSSASRFSRLLVTAGSTFALWHILDFSSQPEWAIVCVCIAGLLSLGANYIEMYLALSLGAYCISPTYGVLATAAWPLLLHQGKATSLLIIFSGILGLLICDYSNKVLLENVLYAVAALGAIGLARPFVAIPFAKRLWFKDLGDIFLTLGLLSVLIYLNPPPLPAPGPAGLTFICVFLLSYVVGLILVKRKPNLFRSLSPFKFKILPNSEGPTRRFKEAPGVAILFRERPYLSKLYFILESESHLAWLLGALGLALVWGLK